MPVEPGVLQQSPIKNCLGSNWCVQHFMAAGAHFYGLNEGSPLMQWPMSYTRSDQNTLGFTCSSSFSAQLRSKGHIFLILKFSDQGPFGNSDCKS